MIVNQQENADYASRTKTMSEDEAHEHGILRRDNKRTATSLYKPLTAAEFLNKRESEIRQEFRKLPNPPAKDTHAAK